MNIFTRNNKKKHRSGFDEKLDNLRDKNKEFFRNYLIRSGKYRRRNRVARWLDHKFLDLAYRL